MDALALLALAFVVVALSVHLLTTLWASRRCRVPPARTLPAFAHGPSVSIIRPVCGLDPHEEATLRSTFALDSRHYEILFCCASRGDPVVALVERLIAEHPHVPARLLIGEDRISLNPKLNNVAKGWRAAAHGWIVIADSNVAMPPDFLQRLLASWREDTGLVSAPPIGCSAQSVWAELECAFLNGYQARWQYAADEAGLGFAQGKVMLWRRSDLEWAGGIRALGAELAEDAAATKVVRGLGLNVRLADGAFPQPLGARTALQVWNRQLRWARLRRATFPGWFAAEPLSGLVPPLLAGAFVALVFDLDVAAVTGLIAGVWLAAELALTVAVGWPLTWRAPLLWLLREAALPVLWMQAWFGSSFSWRGSEISLGDRDEGLRAASGRG